MVVTRSQNILHHGWLNKTVSVFTLGHYPYYVAIVKPGGTVEIRLIGAVTLDIRNVLEDCSVEIVSADTEASIRWIEAIDAPIKSSSTQVTI